MSQASVILAVDDQAPFGKKLNETVTKVNHLWRNRHSLPILESPVEFMNASQVSWAQICGVLIMFQRPR